METNKPTHRCKSILVVEDEKDIRDTLVEILRLEGYDPAVASNGKEAMELLARSARPCLILLDLMMPVMNGWEFLEAQKQDVMIATIPVVVVSAAGENRIRGSAAADGFIKKPVELDALLETVHRYC